MKMLLPRMAALLLLASSGCGSPSMSNFRTQEKPLNSNFASSGESRRQAAGKPTSPLSGRNHDAGFGASPQDAGNAGAAPESAGPSPAEMLRDAQVAESKGQLPQAKALYAEVLRQSPTHAVANHRMAIIADQEQRFSDAEKYYRVAQQQAPQNADLLSDIGYSFFLQGRLDESEGVLKQALQMQPRHQMANSNLAEVYGRRAQLTGNSEDLQKAYHQMVASSGEQAAQARMQQLFPQGQPAGAVTQAAEPAASPLNPFAKPKSSDASATGNLQTQNQADFGAPQPPRATQELLDRIQAAKISPRTPPAAAPIGNGLNGPAPVSYVPHASQSSPARNAPALSPDQIRDEFARIDSNSPPRPQAGNPQDANFPSQSAMNQTWPVPATESTWPNQATGAIATPSFGTSPAGTYEQTGGVQQTVGIDSGSWPTTMNPSQSWPTPGNGAGSGISSNAANDARQRAAQMGLQAGPGQMFPVADGSSPSQSANPGMAYPGTPNSGVPQYGANPGYEFGSPNSGVQHPIYQTPGPAAAPSNWPAQNSPAGIPPNAAGLLPSQTSSGLSQPGNFPTNGQFSVPPTNGVMPVGGELPGATRNAWPAPVNQNLGSGLTTWPPAQASSSNPQAGQPANGSFQPNAFNQYDNGVRQPTAPIGAATQPWPQQNTYAPNATGNFSPRL
jgi:tetratricopeptide (TPR) repeat protein